MKLSEHNAYWNVNRQPTDQVHCNTLGYGELSQYDPLCGRCWLGHFHTWAEHDAQLSEKPTRTMTCPECGGEFVTRNGIEVMCWECHAERQKEPAQ